MSRRLKIAATVVAAALVLVAGGWVLYARVLNDPEAALTVEDLDERVTGTDPADIDSTPPPETTEPDATESSVDGDWTITDGSEVGYRVAETLAGVATEGVGRTTEVSGTLRLDGTLVSAVDVTVDVATITSDSSLRDEQFRGRIMETDRFPTASFVLTEPIDLGAVPAEGRQIQASATGDLTLHGVTRSVTFEVTAQLDGDRIGILGAIPVVFADHDIDNPSIGPVSTGDDGLLEVLLVLRPA